MKAKLPEQADVLCDHRTRELAQGCASFAQLDTMTLKVWLWACTVLYHALACPSPCAWVCQSYMPGDVLNTLQGKRVPVRVFAVTKRGAGDKFDAEKGGSPAAAPTGDPGHDRGSPASAGSDASPATRSTLISDASSVLAHVGAQQPVRRLQPMIGRQVGALTNQLLLRSPQETCFILSALVLSPH